MVSGRWWTCEARLCMRGSRCGRLTSALSVTVEWYKRVEYGRHSVSMALGECMLRRQWWSVLKRNAGVRAAARRVAPSLFDDDRHGEQEDSEGAMNLLKEQEGGLARVGGLSV